MKKQYTEKEIETLCKMYNGHCPTCPFREIEDYTKGSKSSFTCSLLKKEKKK